MNATEAVPPGDSGRSAGRLLLWPALAGVAAVSGFLLARRSAAYDLEGRTVLVTGGSRGLGLVLARELVAAGARVAVCGRDRATLERARTDLAGRGGQVVAVPCDVGVRAEVEALVARVRENLGPIDVLVNNAGTIGVGPLETMTVQDFETTMRTHFWGPLYAVLAVLPDMRRRRAGRIVNIASIGGKIGVPHLVPYCASKFALVGLSEGLRAELAKDGIVVTTVCPGLMRTGSPRHAWFKGHHRQEHAWFSISDALPGLSMDARRAARQVMAALRHGEAERILSWPAKAGVTGRALLPGLAATLLAAVNRALPGADGAAGTRAVEGVDSQSWLSPSWLTILNDRAARRNNQIFDPGLRAPSSQPPASG